MLRSMLERMPARFTSNNRISRDVPRRLGHKLRFRRVDRRSSGVRNRTDGFTLIELLVVVVVMAILVGMLLPALMNSRVVKKRIHCINNLKQVGLSYRIFAMDNEDRFPFQVSTNQGGTKEYQTDPLSAFRHFRAMSNELSAPKVLVCPQDRDRTAATSFESGFGNTNVSYFVGLQARETMRQSILSGDRNLVVDGKRVETGLLMLNKSSVVTWDKDMHRHAGNVAFSDGSVQQLTLPRLAEALKFSHLESSRLLIP